MVSKMLSLLVTTEQMSLKGHKIKWQQNFGCVCACVCVHVGVQEAISKFVLELKEEGVFAKEVRSAGVAFHSYYMASIAPALLEALKKVKLGPSPMLQLVLMLTKCFFSMIQFRLFLGSQYFYCVPFHVYLRILLFVGNQGAATAVFKVGKHQHPTGRVGLSSGSLQFSWIPCQ